MFPLAWIFFGWLTLVVVFGLASLMTLATTLRYGLSCSSTYIATGIFLAVSVGVILMTLGYAVTGDLTLAFDPFSLF